MTDPSSPPSCCIPSETLISVPGMVAGRSPVNSPDENSRVCSKGFSQVVSLRSMTAEPLTLIRIDPFRTSDPTPCAAWIVPILGIVAILVAGYFIRLGKEGWAFVMASLTIVITLVSFFMALYPRVMVSSWGAIYDLTVKNASSSPYTLKVMTIVAVIFVPIVLIYQAWSYRVFRKRIESKPEILTY